jgi:hypothetical protein
MSQEKTAFRIPKGYEDFVSSSQDLLSQFTETGDADSDQVCYHLYLDDLIVNKFDIYSQYQTLRKLKETIEELVKLDVENHIWHRGEPFHLEIVFPTQTEQIGDGTKKSNCKRQNQKKIQKMEQKMISKLEDETQYGMMYLKGATNFGENIEDEWYIVYLLMKITNALKNVSARVFDNDGDFIMIETADHIPDWLGPENAQNRVWIKHGKIHIIPLEAPGQIRTGSSSGMKLANALRYLSNDLQSCRVHGNVQRILASRTTKVFPAKIKALEHCIVCILPEWVLKSFTSNHSLIAGAIRAFGAVDSKDLSATLSKISIDMSQRQPISTSHALAMDKVVAAKVKMTRTLYAQLTFKQFKIPRKYHGMMRRMAVFNSAKVSNAFNIGCRLACGLELAYSESLVEWAESVQWKERNKALLRQSLTEMQFLDEQTMSELLESVLADPVKTSTMFQLDGDDDEGGYVVDDYFDAEGPSMDKTNREDLLLLLANRGRCLVCDVVHGLNLVHHANDSLDTDDCIAAKVIMDDGLLSDSDSWIYMSPEQLDAEMQARIDRFTDLPSLPDDTHVSVGEETSDCNNGTNDDHQTKPIDQDENSNEIERLQQIVDEFKSFLNEQSDFDGISHSKKGGRASNTEAVFERKQPSLKASTLPDQSPFNETTFDVNYLENTLKSLNLRLDGSTVCDDLEVTEYQGPPTEPWMFGIAQKLLPATSGSDSKQPEQGEVESVDSDDESQESVGNEQNDEDESNVSDSSNDDDQEDDDEDRTPWNLDDLQHEKNWGFRYRDASADEATGSYEEEEEENDNYDQEFSMEDMQVSLDIELLLFCILHLM